MAIDIRTSIAPSGPVPLELQVLTTPTRTIQGGKHTFSPTTCTVIAGPAEMVLVDAPAVAEDVDAVIAHLETLDRRLSAVFVTHGHGDHYLGGELVTSRFPGATLVTTPAVASYLDASDGSDTRSMISWFDDPVVERWSQPVAMDGAVLTVDGYALHAIDIGQGDIAPAAVIHVPALGAVVAGDIAYNGIHAMLALGGPEQWADWIASTHAIEALNPKVVVAGHKNPALDDNATRVLSQTRDYIERFTAAFERAKSARDIITAMTEAYPDHRNVTTLVASATAAMGHRAKVVGAHGS